MSDPFETELIRAAKKDFKSLRSWTADILRHLAHLEVNPNAGHTLSGSLHGCRSLEFNLKGSGAFRAVYVIDVERERCVALVIAPHENVYREAERRILALRKSGEIPPLA